MSEGTMDLTHEQWRQVKADIGVLSNAVYPKEACGFLFVNDADVGAASGVYVVDVLNVDDAPWYRFRMDPATVRWAIGTGRLIGVWHSHPADPAVPSEDDVERAVPRMYFLVYAVQDEDLGVFVQEPDMEGVQRGRLVPRTMVMPS